VTEVGTLLESALRGGGARTLVAAAASADATIVAESRGEGAGMDAIFAIASMTKPIVSVAAMQLVERGDLDLDAPASDVLAELRDVAVLEGYDGGRPRLRPASRPITARHLLSHTSGFGYEFVHAEVAEYMEREGVPTALDGSDGFMNVPLICEPGVRHEYGISTDWVGRLIEALSRERLDAYLRANVFDPLGMPDTDFVVRDPARAVPLYARTESGGLDRFDFPPRLEVAFCSGGGGLYSTARDYLRFLQALLCGGELHGTRILGPESFAEMSRNQIGASVAGIWRSANRLLSNDVFVVENAKFGLGFLINPDPLPGARAAGSLFWAGLFNTYFWLDPRSQLCGVLLSQVLPFFDAKVVALLEPFERAVYATTR